MPTAQVEDTNPKRTISIESRPCRPGTKDEATSFRKIFRQPIENGSGNGSIAIAIPLPVPLARQTGIAIARRMNPGRKHGALSPSCHAWGNVAAIMLLDIVISIVPPSDGKAQGRWSAASRRGTKSAGHSLLMPRPEVASHPRRRARSSFKTSPSSPSSPQLPNRQRPTRMSHKFEKRCEARQSEIREGSVLAYVIERIAVITPPRALVVLRFLLNDSQKTACFLAEFHNSLLSNRLKLFSRNR